LRKDIEALQSGAGAVVSAGHQLRERKAQLEAIRDLAKSRKKDLADLLARRTAAQDRMDDVRQRRFKARQTAANDLNNTLGPRIKIGVSRAGQFDIYASAIADILKGSGLRYSDLSSQIAETISPRELIDAADRNDVDALAQAASITEDRAARVLAQIRLSNLGALATVLVDDDVSLQLLDGKVYKPMKDLSTGQRCTVVLPIVLRHIDRMLIVDQPEDHIDNAFIADTLIKAILARSEQSQLLFSTHNANIPVLGNAERVIQLGSDGRRGFVMHEGQLEEPVIVNAITSVMEGGLEAFRQRAKFYEDNSRA
jgi:ATPase subunit of ABC transporter with duplicated ATPase domains